MKPSIHKKLQLVQNIKAHLLSNAGQHEHITVVCHSCHVLPIEYHIQFKLSVLIYTAF